MREMVLFFAVEEMAMMGLPPFDREAPRKKVHLPADAAVELVADRIRADLASKVNLHG